MSLMPESFYKMSYSFRVLIIVDVVECILISVQICKEFYKIYSKNCLSSSCSAANFYKRLLRSIINLSKSFQYVICRPLLFLIQCLVWRLLKQFEIFDFRYASLHYLESNQFLPDIPEIIFVCLPIKIVVVNNACVAVNQLL